MNIPMLGKRKDPREFDDELAAQIDGDQIAPDSGEDKTRFDEFKQGAAKRFDRFFVGADKLEDYYDDKFRVHARIGLALMGLLLAFLVWAFFAKIDEVSRGEGKVVPSSKMQVIQSLEGGIAKEIFVRQGQSVTKGQLIVRLDDTGFSSSMGELDAKRSTLRAQIIRLEFEVGASDLKTLEFPADLVKAAPEVVSSEMRLYQVRKTNFDNQAAILNERLRQRRIELSELKANLERFTENLSIAKRELEIKSPLAAQKVVPETEILRIQREISDLSGQVKSSNLAIPRLEAAIQEAERQLDDHKLNFRQTAQQDLNQRLGELNVVDQSLKGAKDRVVRTDVRSPVDGIVNRINFTTVGGVVRPGEVIAEVVPLEDALLIEVKIKPSDIAFIHVGQAAVVRLTAYDFSIYGSLHGTVTNVSPDSITDQNTKETYYTVMVQTKESALRSRGDLLPILPGMIATVDVITGAKSILQYILKPIVKAKAAALRER
ncbi:MAG: HlyD family type I secretion periplasmic adaptor subunit [Xanthobacteraceae bacterium]|nr:HlyD family type I secretion periplasmic adaptor subunit [Xanthobacteraceae bacterium]